MHPNGTLECIKEFTDNFAHCEEYTNWKKPILRYLYWKNTQFIYYLFLCWLNQLPSDAALNILTPAVQIAAIWGRGGGVGEGELDKQQYSIKPPLPQPPPPSLRLSWAPSKLQPPLTSLPAYSPDSMAKSCTVQEKSGTVRIL